jgi:hypothetical protein
MVRERSLSFCNPDRLSIDDGRLNDMSLLIAWGI